MKHLNQLLKQVSDKDHKAFEQLYRESSPKLLALTMRLVNQNQAMAEDILQDAFIKIWNKAEQYNESKGSAMSWMSILVRNQTYDNFRSIKYRPAYVEEAEYEGIEYTAQDSAPDALLSKSEQYAIFQGLLDNLPTAQKNTVTQSLVYGYSHSEIAERLGVPLGTVKARLRRNMALFQEHLSKQSCLDIAY
ncbi:MAG: RNA polymerase sigma-70 factor (ECF subfamily) [Cocleimonas sp.]|jgi:RNA polymerase sigma-70 factor (ECF subfamily)